MKPNSIQRSVRSTEHDRSPGDAPSIGRVARMPGTGLPKQMRRMRRKGESSKREKLSKSRLEQRKMRIWVYSVTALLFLGGGALLILIRQGASHGGGEAGMSEKEKDLQVRVVSKFPSPSKEAALEFVKNALAVKDAGKVARSFRVHENRHQEVVDFLGKMGSRDGEITDYQWLSSIDANRLSLDGVNVVFKGKDRISNRMAVLTPDETGNWKIDFDAFARTVSPSWNAILAPETREAVVRVFVAKDSYFNGPFRDEKEWVCYGMASPDTEEVLLGYCRLNSPQEAALQDILSKGEKLKRVTLGIRRVESGEARQFEISQVIAEDWVVTDAIFQANFADVQLRLPDPLR